jgi:tRNA(Ile)-lysidine synthase
MAASRNRPSTDLVERVGIFLAARIKPGERLCVGLSGGCDSVVLTHLLHRIVPESAFSALHVHHGLSPNADAWEDFCVDYCARLGVPLSVSRVAVGLGGGLGLEAAARAARYAAFGEADIDCILLAHHRGDQAETVLHNLLRGAGVTGAAAMPMERHAAGLRVLRPLLAVSRGEIEAYAEEHGLAWIRDESNDDRTLTRNYIRHQCLVDLTQRFPAAEAALAQAAANFAEAAGLLDELAEQDWQQVSEGESARLAELRRLSLPRLKNLLRYRLRCLAWRVPAAARMDEFARQLLAAGSDRHPELRLPDGLMRAGRGRLVWLPDN